MKFILFSILFFLSGVASAYPDFIGFGYHSCLSCHESGTGGGALTDYGRGVFASEIAANPLSKWMNDDDAAQISNFLGRTEFPWWVRMGFKYRALTVEANPGSAASQKFYFNMQNDLNFNLYADEKHTKALITTFGYIENIPSLTPNKTFSEKSHLYAREYFLKYGLPNDFWVYGGFMDKTFGIKTPNHTSVNRQPLRLGQFDQVHGVLVQWARKEEDFFLHGWVGNTQLEESERWQGGSFMFDKKWGGTHSYGASVLSEKKTTVQQSIASVHNKMGFGEGNALLMELGLRDQKTTIAATTNSTQDYYLFTQGNLRLARGLFILSDLELARQLKGANTPQSMKWDLGLLLFPIQRIEARISAVNQKTFGASEGTEDQWAIQSQIHLSL